ncbi:hypothetical protein K435DRAFT_858859 [Dendrothele bispora CBS 962.96]|uniref:Uncharacterized protein n=1 Tax=Dendrothele bispora (strain CBS 962.96) TaxID=1314807 RepID=A0A4S8M332_DENBC|nr:hypothetical protein K435DRAFT_858859 [Dendrothele bispora CBS 962.96]
MYLLTCLRKVPDSSPVYALGTFSSFQISPATFIAYPFNFLINRMYIAALLVTLNPRMGLRTSAKETTEDFAMSVSHVQFKRVQNSTTGTINDSRPAPVSHPHLAPSPILDT